jgi:hypothetical protein
MATGLASVDEIAASRCFDPFRALSDAERTRHLDAYACFLEQRDGTIDLANRTLSQRELFFRDVERKRVTWKGGIDPEGFWQRFLGTGKPPVDARTLWLIALAKANEGETYGVELELQRLARRNHAGVDRREIYLLLEEQYHSRILAEACRTCGFELKLQPPRWSMRLVIRLIQVLPEWVRWVPVLCGEVLGSTVFKLLRDNCDLFAADPAVEARLHSLLSEIWLDEVLHVAYLRARLGPRSLRAAQALLPLVVTILMKDVPQLRDLGCDPAELLARVRAGLEIPDAVDWMASDPDAGA